MNSNMSWLTGLAAGATAMYLLDPAQGRRRRALVRDQATHASHKLADAAGATARDLSHRGAGVASNVQARLFGGDTPDDDVLESRIRSRIGRLTSHPSSIEVDVRDGCVTLRGPILASEVNSVIRAAERVRGVREVVNQLEEHEQAGSVPGLQGGAPRLGNLPDIAQTNWPPATRLAVGSIGCALAIYGAGRRDPASVGLLALGSVLIARAATNLETRRLFGVGAGRRAVDLAKTLHVNAPVDEVFSFWENFQNFPQFMTHVRNVRRMDGQRSRWTVEGPGGVAIEFDAVVTEHVPNEVLAWKTVEGAIVGHSGLIRFDPTGPTSTRVHIRMSYNPPAGAIGHGVAALLGQDLRRLMNDDLVRMKTLIEGGNPPHDAAQPAESSTVM